MELLDNRQRTALQPAMPLKLLPRYLIETSILCLYIDSKLRAYQLTQAALCAWLQVHNDGIGIIIHGQHLARAKMDTNTTLLAEFPVYLDICVFSACSLICNSQHRILNIIRVVQPFDNRSYSTIAIYTYYRLADSFDCLTGKPNCKAVVTIESFWNPAYTC